MSMIEHPDGVARRPPCPRRPSSSDPSELGFVRRPMVRWLDPHQLVDTSARVLLSGLFSSYADSRDMQALVPSEVLDHSDEPEMWLDYVADLGDGWNSTYTIARLMAGEELTLDIDGRPLPTPRGEILVMGGDQVYPVPKSVEYENRLLGPYRSALPCVDGPGPELLAIPGSHDWYDGLVNFTSVFCRGRWIGGWKTRQRRSYFALRLPHGWWLWGIDIQFGDYLDEVQLQYFSDAATQSMQPGDKVILCMAKEVQSGRSTDETYSDRDVDYLEREIIEPSGGEVLLYLKSGRHYYCRYQEEFGQRQHITSGGGGAFLHPTHNLPEYASLPEGGHHGGYRKAATYPSADESRRLRKRVWLLAPYNLPLAGVFGLFHVLLAFMMGLHLRERHLGLSVADLRQAMWESPIAFVLILVMVVLLAAMVRFAHEATGLVRVLLGTVHSVLQLTSVAAVLIVASRLSTSLGLRGAASLMAFLALVAVLGGIGGTVGISGYLWATNCFGLHGNEAYAPLHHADMKHFLRLHFGPDGVLSLYPIGVNRVGRKWRLRPDAPPSAPWFEPVGREPAAHLIEGPLRFGEGTTEPE